MKGCLFVMKYEELLTTRDALLHALGHLETCKRHSELTQELAPDYAMFVLEPQFFATVIDEIRRAYFQVGTEIFNYEWEQNRTIAANTHVLYTEDVPF